MRLYFAYLLLRECKGLLGVAAGAGLVSGAANVAVIALVTHTLAQQPPSIGSRPILLFCGLVLTLVAALIISRIWLTRLSQTLIYQLRVRVIHRILAASLRQQEAIGKARLLVAMDRDVHDLSEALWRIPVLLPDIVNALCLLAFIAYLSWPMLIGALITTAIYIVVSLLPRAGIDRSFRLQREEGERLSQLFHTLVDGAKELKLHASRRAAFFREMLDPSLRACRSHVVRSTTLFHLGEASGRLVFFAAAGLALFGLRSLPNGTEVLSALVLSTLSLMGPIGNLMYSIPQIKLANLALADLRDLHLIDRDDSALAPPPEPSTPELPLVPELIELYGVSHAYHHAEDGRSFTLGPIDLELRAREITFITGENGSGKTTLAKLLCGLYLPDTGSVRMDGVPVTPANQASYCEHVSAVFDDCYIFDRLLGLSEQGIEQVARELLARMLLDHKVHLVDGRFSTLALSSGQRKRLALLVAWLEDRQVCVFDEWTAGQASSFKQVFYTELLPELKRRGKIIVVISHDEAYFGAADRLLELVDGRLSTTTAHGASGPDGPQALHAV